MSNIYIQEPSANGKVLLVTTVGDIDIELWSKEAPKACRNFVQLCLESYYDNTIFHRVVPNFIVQGGDPDGTGEGGESIYGAPFKDEFHSRLRFVRRGLVAMANAGPNDNGSQFFFTMNQTPELQNKHTIFGKVTGPTLFNMLRLQEVETDDDDRPIEPHKVIKSEILVNPFDDIIPRVVKKAKKDNDDQKKIKSKSKATKNFSLLSFGEEAEEDEEQTFKASKKFSGKSKSSHDLIDDPNLSSVPAMDKSDKRRNEDEDDFEDKEAVRKKLKKENPHDIPLPDISGKAIEDDSKSKRMEEAKKESRRLQKDIKAAKKKEKQEENSKHKDKVKEDNEPKAESGDADFLQKFKLERQKYKNLKKEQNKKGQGREAQTLALLSKFQSKLSSVKQLNENFSDTEGEKEPEETDDNDDISWMGHKLQFEEDKKNKVLDANVADEDRYEINDPRNPLTQRRREASKKKAKHK